MKIREEHLKFQQIEAAFRYIVDNKEIYKSNGLHDIYEFGVYKGASLEKISEFITYSFREDFDKHPLIYGFDSFEGLPKEQEGLSVFEKFQEGSYNASKDSSTPIIDVYERVGYSGLHIIAKPFKWLTENDVYSTMRPALLVHIDADLYSSTRLALLWMFNNFLIGDNTLIAYDEFSVEGCEASEEKAHNEVFKGLNNFSCEEVWKSIYFDKTNGKKVSQNVFRVIRND